MGLRPSTPLNLISAACAAWLAWLPGTAVSEEVRAVIELFTSQGCSSCPPADKLLGEFAKDPSIVAVTLPVDYWDYLGWKDTLAKAGYSERQRAYARVRGDREIATPQVVVNGIIPVVGSDLDAIERAIKQTRKTVTIAPVSTSVSGDKLTVTVGASNSEQNTGEVWICAMAEAVPVTIERGENTGRSMIYHNVSRRWVKVGDWNGKAATWSIPLRDVRQEGANIVAAIVQSGTAKKPGPVLGAALTSLN